MSQKNQSHSEGQTKDERPVKTQLQCTVPDGHTAEIRLDKYLATKLNSTSRTKIKEAIDDDLITVNGSPEKASYIIEGGDVIDVTIPRPPRPEAKPENIPINVMYEEDDFLIVHKPAGMVVHPGVGNWSGTLVNGLMYYCDSLAETDNADIRPGLVHRIDKDTSGLLVVAKTDEALSILSEYFKNKEAERTYWALVWGHPSYKRGKIFGPIGRDPKDRKKFAVVKPEDGKQAVTRYKVLEYFDHLTLLELKLETGRTHQVRIHFSHNDMPVFGDPVYGGSAVRYGPNTGPRKSMFNELFARVEGQCLHARTLGFDHPRTGRKMNFESALPDDFKYVLDTLREKCK